MITIDATGPLSVIEDLGRPGLAHLGVSPSGAADLGALRLANRLVGNRETAAAIEVTLGGLALSTDETCWVAVTGAPAQVQVNKTPTASHTSIVLHPGDQLTLVAPAEGLRNYVAFRGGIRCAATLGSRATDVLSGLGPTALQAGQQLSLDQQQTMLPDIDVVAAQLPSRRLFVAKGPRTDWFTDTAWTRLTQSSWSVTQDCDRVAVRLHGPQLTRSRDDELPSEGLVRGAIQVPASGQPLIFLSDHPVTGGYPVIGVLTSAAADQAAQLRPGDIISFHSG